MTGQSQSEYMRNYRTANKQRLSEAAKEYRRKHDPRIWSEKNRASHLKTKYGLSVLEYEALLKSQRGACAICKFPNWNGRGPHVDHDHKTKRVRGILCPSCNAAIGFIKENPIIALSMVEYLKKRCNRRIEYVIDIGTQPLNTRELANLLRLSTKTIDRWCHKRNLPFIRQGFHKIFIPADLKAWAIACESVGYTPMPKSARMNLKSVREILALAHELTREDGK